MSAQIGTYGPGKKKHKRQAPPPAEWFHKYPKYTAKLPSAPPKPEGAVGSQPWGVLPAKPPKARET